MSALKGASVRRQEKQESETVEHQILAPSLQFGTAVRCGWFLIVAGFLGVAAWAATAPLDKGIATAGEIVVSSNRKPVSSGTDGVISKLFVVEGESVRAGQILIKLDETLVDAEQELASVQLASTRAEISRLTAERDQALFVSFDEDLATSNDTRIAAALQLQTQLFLSRKEALAAEISAMTESLSGLEHELTASLQVQLTLEQQSKALKTQLSGLRALEREGYTSRNRLLDVERLHAQSIGSLAEGGGRVSKLRRQIAEQHLRVDERKLQFQTQVREQLAQSILRHTSHVERLKSARYRQSQSNIVAPSAGRVIGLSVFSHGEYVRSGQKTMEIVPSDDLLIVHARLPVELSDRIEPGMEVEVMMNTVDHGKSPSIDAYVQSVGADRRLDERTGQAYYLIEIHIADRDIERFLALNGRPGMPVQVFVRFGERSLLTYLFKPLADRLHGVFGQN